MTHNWNRNAILSGLAACCSLAIWIESTNAKDEETSVLVKKSTTPSAAPVDGPVLPPPARPAAPVQDPFAPTQPTTPQPAAPLVAPQLQAPSLPMPTPPPARSTVKRPFMRPAQPLEPARGQLSAQTEPMPIPEGQPLVAPPTRELNVRPTPPIEYDTDHDARKMYRAGQIQLVVVTQDPSDGCLYEIPLCIPACCTGEPKVVGGKGLLGRGVVEYCWACGFKAKVKFRHVLGDVKVEYEGD